MGRVIRIVRPENERFVSVHRAATHTDQGIVLRFVALRRCVSKTKLFGAELR